MYGNIGLPTAKGSGTSGYVQKSLAYINKKNYQPGNYKEILDKFRENPLSTKRKPNQEIIIHELKHKIECELFEYAEILRAQKKLSEKEITAAINKKRMELQQNIKKNESADADTNETHQKSMLKDQQMEKIKSALGVKNEYVPGTAFDLEIQEQKKQERLHRIKEEKKRRKKKHHHKNHSHRKRLRSRSKSRNRSRSRCVSSSNSRRRCNSKY